MCLTGVKVSHPQFGEGVILFKKDGYIHVRFEAPYGEKTFVYPDAFSGFLSLQDAAGEPGVARDLADKRQREADAQARRLEKLQALQDQLTAEKAASRSVRPRTVKKAKPTAHP